MEIVYNLVVLGISNLGEAMLPKTSGATTNLGVGMRECFNVVLLPLLAFNQRK
jgi:hypothetical protein